MPYISPFMTYETRARLGRKLAELWPGTMEKSFFTLGGAECNENAIRIAKAYTGRQKILARYRSYHGATYATINLTGDPRRWANQEPPMPGVVHVLDPYHGTQRGTDDAESLVERAARDDRAGRARDHRGLHPGARDRHERHPPARPTATSRASGSCAPSSASVMIADEVMCGFGRTGEWFAVNHWDVKPDLMSTAKGLTSSYLPLGALALTPEIAAFFDEHVFWGGLTYNSHPLSCAAALAAIG